MSILLAFFGFFTLLSAVALVKFEGNPIFIFTLLLCLASLLTIWRIDRDEPGASRPAGRKSSKPASRRKR